ncbi:hypothetical protein NEMBOFW57_007340 [Staphylotrichum longicolle]|uniref:DUF7735 domain-containing protein n=1 Tax=Staphylotrichum longicolle TaxID=669026 RepID=A0AAD4HV41_9PEZI|nr:hypothetical protein NEMBOFW57_007340 [Staphylotrichum longicolle]
MHFSALATGLTAAIAVLGVSARFVPDSPPVTRQHDSLEKRQATSTLLQPTTRSTLSPDPWQCITENITQYFDVPKPTGNVLDAIGLYGDEVVKDCKATATGRARISCTVSDSKSWCGFTTAAPADILSSYSTYVSEVVSFWTSKSSTMSILSTSCPVAWRRFSPGESEWLKIATAHANCYLEAHSQTQAQIQTQTQTQTDTSAPTATTGDANASSTATARTTTPTTSEAGVSRRGHALKALALMGMGLVALAHFA